MSHVLPAIKVQHHNLSYGPRKLIFQLIYKIFFPEGKNYTLFQPQKNDNIFYSRQSLLIKQKFLNLLVGDIETANQQCTPFPQFHNTCNQFLPH